MQERQQTAQRPGTMEIPMSEVAREDSFTSQEAKLPQKTFAVCTLAHVHPFDQGSRARGSVGEPKRSCVHIFSFMCDTALKCLVKRK
jgi:hypothetical protein